MKKVFTVLAVISTCFAAKAQIVINEVYGGGGNSGATYKNDFVELYNRGTSTVTLNGAYLQYASSTGTFGSTTNPDSNKLQLPNITLGPGQYYLIQLAAGTGGTVNLPTPDYAPTGTTAPTAPIAVGSSGGKIALTSSITSVNSPTDANVVDFVGWGTGVSAFEGAAAAPATSNTTSVSRTNGIDTNNNGADFTSGNPTPQNSSTLALGTVDFSNDKINLVKFTSVKNEVEFSKDAKVSIYNSLGQMVAEQKVRKDSSMNISSLPAGVYYVNGIVNGEKVSQKILKK